MEEDLIIVISGEYKLLHKLSRSSQGRVGKLGYNWKGKEI